ncbi:MAG: hypothetical protein R2741_03450 [Methanolobus sp.]
MDWDYYIYTFPDESSVSWESSDNGLLASTVENDPFQTTQEQLSQLKKSETVYFTSDDGTHLVVLSPFEDYTGETKGYIKSAIP